MAGALNVYPNLFVNVVIVSHPKAGIPATVPLLAVDERVPASDKISNGLLKTTIDAGKPTSGNYRVVFENKADKIITLFIKNWSSGNVCSKGYIRVKAAGLLRD